jgi:hypothetical protein
VFQIETAEIHGDSEARAKTWRVPIAGSLNATWTVSEAPPVGGCGRASQHRFRDRAVGSLESMRIRGRAQGTSKKTERSRMQNLCHSAINEWRHTHVFVLETLVHIEIVKLVDFVSMIRWAMQVSGHPVNLLVLSNSG